MSQFHTFVYQIGELVIGAAFLFFGVWLASVSDYFRYFAQLLFFLAWLAISTGASLYVVVLIHLPSHQYLAASFTLLIGAFLFIPWYAIAYPEIQKIIKDIKSKVNNKVASKNESIKSLNLEPPNKFPKGTKFADIEGVPVASTDGVNTWAFDSETPRRFNAARFSKGTLITERAFRDLVTSAQAETKSNQFINATRLGLPIKFAPGTELLNVEGVPVSLTKDWVCRAWDKSKPRPFSFISARENGTLISERAFFELVDKAKAEIKSNHLKS